MTYIFKIHLQDWRDGSVGTSMCCAGMWIWFTSLELIKTSHVCLQAQCCEEETGESWELTGPPA